MSLFWWIVIPLWTFAFYLAFIRNSLVFRHQKRTLDRILALYKAERGTTFDPWRWDMFRRVQNYNIMMLKFWRPLKSFAPPPEEWVKSS